MNGLPREKAREPGKSSGLTMAEVIVALVLLAIGLVGASSLLVTESRARRHAQCTSLAADVASRKVGEVEAAGYRAVEQGKLPASFTVPELPQGQGSVCCEASPTTNPRSDYLVTVTVTWGAGKGPRGRTIKSGVVPRHG